jgi:hypothetical protein
VWKRKSKRVRVDAYTTDDSKATQPAEKRVLSVYSAAVELDQTAPAPKVEWKRRERREQSQRRTSVSTVPTPDGSLEAKPPLRAAAQLEEVEDEDIETIVL